MQQSISPAFFALSPHSNLNPPPPPQKGEGVVAGTGHFHVVVDRAASDALPAGVAIPFDATHLHYGKGQLAADIELPAGKHTLSLQFANALHESYGPAERKDITINVQ